MILKSKVVSSKEMARVEKLSLSQGCSEQEFMERAGSSVAEWTEKFVLASQIPKRVIVLAGKGNNGGDAFAAGAILLQRGFEVEAFHIYSMEVCSPLCIIQAERFIEAGGVIRYELSCDVFSQKGVILDGLVGTGFRGKPTKELEEAICFANHSSWPTLAIDIPSGVCGSTGRVETCAIQSKATIYLERAKTGFFLEQGWDYVGELCQGTFGLPAQYLEEMKPDAFLIEGKGLTSLLSPPLRTQNKYKRGYVLVLAGSRFMMGAGVLASQAALRGGAGIVRWFHPEELEERTSGSLAEVIRCPVSSLEEWFTETKRAKALVVGPGMGRDERSFAWIRQALTDCAVPVVIDADALFFLSENPDFILPKQAVLTPHLGEMKRLLSAHKIEGDFLSSCQQFVDKMKVTLLVKGAPNFLFHPGEVPSILPFGNAGMATAGSGDVLSGLLGARLAQKMCVLEAVMLGCYIHGLAGDLAVKDKTVFCLTASDLLAYLPKAFSSFGTR